MAALVWLLLAVVFLAEYTALRWVLRRVRWTLPPLAVLVSFGLLTVLAALFTVSAPH